MAWPTGMGFNISKVVLCSRETGCIINRYWFFNKKNGYGVERWPNGEVYSGCFIDGLKEGRGEFVWLNGAKYVGEFAQGKI